MYMVRHMGTRWLASQKASNLVVPSIRDLGHKVTIYVQVDMRIKHELLEDVQVMVLRPYGDSTSAARLAKTQVAHPFAFRDATVKGRAGPAESPHASTLIFAPDAGLAQVDEHIVDDSSMNHPPATQIPDEAMCEELDTSWDCDAWSGLLRR